jgi:septum site-determining protein MinC
MNKVAHAARESACDIRFGQVGLAQIHIRTTDADAIHAELSTRRAAAPQLFERTPVCLDLSALEHDPTIEEARAFVDAVRRAGMLPVGLSRGAALPMGLHPGTEAIDQLSQQLDLPILTQIRARRMPAPMAPGTPEALPPPANVNIVSRTEVAAGKDNRNSDSKASAQLHLQPVRSGQRVYARQRDLIVTTVVGAGAEVMADGCVHVYSTLRGRALAGARGDTSARVFCQEFHAELVSIAGVFRVFETIPEELVGKPVQAWLEGDDLRFARIGN